MVVESDLREFNSLFDEHFQLSSILRLLKVCDLIDSLVLQEDSEGYLLASDDVCELLCLLHVSCKGDDQVDYEELQVDGKYFIDYHPRLVVILRKGCYLNYARNKEIDEMNHGHAGFCKVRLNFVDLSPQKKDDRYQREGLK